MEREKVSPAFILFLIIIGFFVVGLVFYTGKLFVSFLKAIPLSPLDDNTLIENLESCSDSDGGIVFFERGEILYAHKFLAWDWQSNLMDKCNGNKLVEYYCQSNGAVKGIVKCENGCEDGRCMK